MQDIAKSGRSWSPTPATDTATDDDDEGEGRKQNDAESCIFWLFLQSRHAFRSPTSPFFLYT